MSSFCLLSYGFCTVVLILPLGKGMKEHWNSPHCRHLPDNLLDNFTCSIFILPLIDLPIIAVSTISHNPLLWRQISSLVPVLFLSYFILEKLRKPKTQCSVPLFALGIPCLLGQFGHYVQTQESRCAGLGKRSIPALSATTAQQEATVSSFAFKPLSRATLLSILPTLNLRAKFHGPHPQKVTDSSVEFSSPHSCL
jgi:hypothetical protein